jgi:hypothetical protein
MTPTFHSLLHKNTAPLQRTADTIGHDILIAARKLIRMWAED